MAEAGLFIGWGQVVRNREERALEVFNETMQFYGHLQEQGEIERFDVALLQPHGGDLDGFVLLRGSEQQIDSLRRREDFERLMQRADLIVERLGIVSAVVDEALAEGLGDSSEHRRGLDPWEEHSDDHRKRPDKGDAHPRRTDFDPSPTTVGHEPCILSPAVNQASLA